MLVDGLTFGLPRLHKPYMKRNNKPSHPDLDPFYVQKIVTLTKAGALGLSFAMLCHWLCDLYAIG